MNMSKQAQIVQAITPTEGAAGTSAINATALDLASTRAHGVLAIVTMGAITSTAVTSVKLQHSTDNSTWDDIEGSSQTIADTDDDKVFYLDAVRPTKRYLRVVVSRGTANAVVASANYILYGIAEMPITHGTGVAGETTINPVTGTA